MKKTNEFQNNLIAEIIEWLATKNIPYSGYSLLQHLRNDFRLEIGLRINNTKIIFRYDCKGLVLRYATNDCRKLLHNGVTIYHEDGWITCFFFKALYVVSFFSFSFSHRNSFIETLCSKINLIA